MREIDNLTEDPAIQGQKYVCLSFVSPEGIQGCTIRTLKIRGVYAKYEQAQERAKYLQETDPDFNVFIGEVGKWLPWDPSPDTAKDQVYYEKEMQELVSGHKENLAKAKKEVQARAADSHTKPLSDAPANSGQDRKQKQLEKMRETLRKKNKGKEDKEHMKNQIEGDVSSYNNYMAAQDSVESKIDQIKQLQKEI